MKLNISDIKVEGNQIKVIGTTQSEYYESLEDSIDCKVDSLEIIIDAKSLYSLVNLVEEIKKLR